MVLRDLKGSQTILLEMLAYFKGEIRLLFEIGTPTDVGQLADCEKHF